MLRSDGDRVIGLSFEVSNVVLIGLLIRCVLAVQYHGVLGTFRSNNLTTPCSSIINSGSTEMIA
jgi:hypothetical protein